MTSLSEDQVRRARTAYDIAYPGVDDGFTGFLDRFENEEDPEREIRIWEWVTKSLAEYEESHEMDAEARAEMLQHMVTRSMFPSAEAYLEANPLDDTSLEEVRTALLGMEKFRAECGVAKANPIQVSVGGATPVLDQVEAFLEERGVSGQRADGECAYFFGVSLQNGNYRCVAKTREAEGLLVFQSHSLESVPEEKIPEALWLIAQLNLRFSMGSLQLNPAGGELSFRTTLASPPAMVNVDLLIPVVDFNLRTMDQCHPHLVGFAQGKLTGEEALKACLGT